MDLSQILGHTATLLFSIMLLPQFIKTIKTKSVADISLGMFIICVIANIIAFCYALLIHQLPLLIKYTIGLTTSLIYIGIYLKYVKR